MLWLIFLLLQTVPCDAGVATDVITVCAKENANMKMRPFPLPTACQNTFQALCDSLFPAPDDGGDIAANINPMMDFKVNEVCMNASLQSIAITKCPSSCAMCCKSKMFDCANAAGADCAGFEANLALCNDPLVKDTAASKCPQTCGFCLIAGPCPDSSPDCAAIKPALTCDDAIMKEKCQNTCKLTTCLTSTTLVAGCIDEANDCANIKAAGLCNSNALTPVQLTRCRRTCGTCIP